MAFSAPLIAGLLCFTLLPVLGSAYLSFTQAPLFGRPVGVGVANYRELMGDARFWLSVRNTLSFALFAVPLGMVAGLAMALLLNTKVRGMAFYRTMFFLPTVVPTIASCVLWTQLLNPDHGLVNQFLRLSHVPETWIPGWLTSETWSKPALVLMSVWGAGGGMVLYLAALQDVPQELHEAAAIDGAGAWRRLYHVTLPAISPVLLFTAVTGLIGAMQYFAQAMVMTNGGPWDSTLFYSLNLFDTAFTEYRLGYASAMAWIMFLLVLLLTAAVLRISRRHVHYQG
ncbi:MAG: carbohydrate ABC transporter permease [Tepidisphaeraceae bacterium]